MYLLPVWCSLNSFLIAASWGKHLGGKGIFRSSIFNIFLCTVSSFSIFFEVCLCHSVRHIRGMPRIELDLISINWGFLYDPSSSSMLIIINLISLCANIYSVEYMASDPHKIRFCSYPPLFTFFMSFLVLSDNALQLFVGWEGVGICSYLSINFWYSRVQANKSALLALMANKVGDIFFLFGCILIHLTYKSVDYAVVNSILDSISINEVSLWVPMAEYRSQLICLCLSIASIGKSAQVGSHMWSPEAMEGPTPVSSLIHAATMVTAGIFSVSRCSYLSHNIDSVFLYLIVIGSITSFFSSTIGLFQTDIKRVVAYSTRSQLGYMFICRGSPAYSNSMYHLFNHAFYKALLFLTAGYIIHALSNEQDLRRMGSLLKLLPFPYMMMLIGSLSPVGSPFFSGYYSKDKIVELCFNSFIHVFPASHHHKYLIFSQILSTLAVIFTIAYSLKLLLNIFLYSYGGAVQYFHNLHFPSFFMQIPLLILAFLSMVSGYITSDMMVGIGTNLWQKSFPSETFFFANANDNIDFLKASSLLHTEYNKYTRYITIVWTLYFVIVSIVVWIMVFERLLTHAVLSNIFGSMELFTMISKKFIFFNRLFVVPLLRNAFKFSYKVTYKLVDKGIIELLGPSGIVSGIKAVIQSQYRLQTGFIYHYSGIIFIMLIPFMHMLFEFLCLI